MDHLYPPSIFIIVDNLFSFPYLRYAYNLINRFGSSYFVLFRLSSPTPLASLTFFPAYIILMLVFLLFSQLGGFGMTLSHHQAALFTARRLELCDLVQDTLLYLHPDSRVHSHLSPLAYQVIFSSRGFVYMLVCLPVYVCLCLDLNFLAMPCVRYASSIGVRPCARDRSAVCGQDRVDPLCYFAHHDSNSIDSCWILPAMNNILQPI